MLAYELMQLIAAVILLVPLIRGAASDIRTRIFPKEYWSLPAKIAGVFTILMYILAMAYYKDLAWIGVCLGASLIAATILYAIGIRYGSGGDCRALIYCAIIAPLVFFTPEFIVLLCLISIALAFYELSKESSEHIFQRHIPWAVAICGAFIITLLLEYAPAIMG